MTLQIRDRVMESSTTTGTGAMSLGGAYTGFRTFSSVCADQDTCWYEIDAVDANGFPTGDWETGYGTYNSSGNTLSRTVVTDSSNSGSAVSFSAGTKRVAISVIAAKVNGIANATVATDESTSSTTFTDLTTPGPSVTLVTGKEVIVIASALIFKTTSGLTTGHVGVNVSGATTIATVALIYATSQTASGTTAVYSVARSYKLSGLTPGTNTFKLQYLTESGTMDFQNRDITVIAL